jgi:hypothetical protein
MTRRITTPLIPGKAKHPIVSLLLHFQGLNYELCARCPARQFDFHAYAEAEAEFV